MSTSTTPTLPTTPTAPTTPTSPAASTLQLEDIHLPDPVSFWPLAPGWWLLLIALLLLSGVILYQYRHTITHWFQSRRLKHELIDALDECHQEWQQHHKNALLCANLNAQLKRYCRRCEPQVLSLSGDAWVDWLESRSGQTFSADHRQALAHGPYQVQSTLTESVLTDLYEQCVDWVNQVSRHPVPQGGSH